MEVEQIVVGLRLRLLVTPPDPAPLPRRNSRRDPHTLSAGSIGIVTRVDEEPWRFWLRWPFPTSNRYGHAYEAVDLRHFEIVSESMREAECASVNYHLAERMNPSR